MKYMYIALYIRRKGLKEPAVLYTVVHAFRLRTQRFVVDIVLHPFFGVDSSVSKQTTSCTDEMILSCPLPRNKSNDGDMFRSIHVSSERNIL